MPTPDLRTIRKRWREGLGDVARASGTMQVRITVDEADLRVVLDELDRQEKTMTDQEMAELSAATGISPAVLSVEYNRNILFRSLADFALRQVRLAVTFGEGESELDITRSERDKARQLLDKIYRALPPRAPSVPVEEGVRLLIQELRDKGNEVTKLRGTMDRMVTAILRETRSAG